MRLQLNLISKKHLLVTAGILAILFSGCQPNSCLIEPNICYLPQKRMIERLPPSFEPLSSEEMSQNWGKELFVARAFANEMDLYRAITCFKKALFLLPTQKNARRCEIEYDLFLAYYLGNKFQEAIEVFDTSHLLDMPLNFPAFNEFLILLYDVYLRVDQPEKACQILGLIATKDENTANGLILGTALKEANFPLIDQTAPFHPAGESISTAISDFQYSAKSVKKAQTLNALLPGAGYYYVGQKKSALTSFLINALFVAASYQLFERGYAAAGIITASLEMGWYFGGINGAGLEAKEYNERLYESLGKEALIKERLFPILMIQKGF